MINTLDCGSSMRRFDSYMAPQLSVSIAVIFSSSPGGGAEVIILLGTENNIPLNDGVLTLSIGITLLFVKVKSCRPFGEVAKWSNAADCKSVPSGSMVQIHLPPPLCFG